eukprot:CAMPEP_0117539750 /NCGR_PEP_ID=MMETSP0784-20121206/43145_1 /TAXON_ID=39447 /ORGANISM="" /LENGTH=348 /DNA_ID=CAMNT_0005336385 /DNA_START=94 /DNA_END=1138 /DNA_ORIENTATION=+
MNRVAHEPVTSSRSLCSCGDIAGCYSNYGEEQDWCAGEEQRSVAGVRQGLCRRRRQVLSPAPVADVRHRLDEATGLLNVLAPTTDALLMTHYLAHYAALEVDLPARAHVVLHVIDKKSLGEMLSVLRSYGIRPAREIGRYDPATKANMANAWLDRLPADAWAINADSDEFFEFPCELRNQIREGKDAFLGHMAERVGANLTFPELRASPNISDQYPISCPGLRKNIGNWANISDRVLDYKYVLFKVTLPGRVRRRFHGNHIVLPVPSEKATVQLGRFPHYAMTGSSFFIKLRHKITMAHDRGKENMRNALYASYIKLFKHGKETMRNASYASSVPSNSSHGRSCDTLP